MTSLDKASIEKKINQLENQDTEEINRELFIAKKKIEALNSSHYDKI